MVLHQHQVDLDAFLHRGDQLGRHHQVGAVADQREHLARRVGQPGADRRRDLVAHAREAVLDVVLPRLLGTPQLVQVLGHRPGRVDHHVAVVKDLVEHAKHLSLSRPLVPGRAPRRPLDHLRPALRAGAVLLHVVLGHAVPGQHLGQLSQRRARIADHRGRRLLVGVQRGDVDVDEPNVRVGEQSPGGGGEVRVAGADADDQVRGTGDVVGDRGAGVPDGPELAGVVEAQRATARLRFGHRNSGALGESPQRFFRTAVVYPAPGDDQRTLRRPDPLGGLGDRPRVRCRAVHPPHPLGEELLRPVVRLGLHVLRQRQGHRAGLHRVGEHPHRVQCGGDQRFRPPDPVEVARHRPQAVVDRDVPGVRDLQLL